MRFASALWRAVRLGTLSAIDKHCQDAKSVRDGCALPSPLTPSCFARALTLSCCHLSCSPKSAGFLRLCHIWISFGASPVSSQAPHSDELLEEFNSQFLERFSRYFELLHPQKQLTNVSPLSDIKRSIPLITVPRKGRYLDFCADLSFICLLF